MSDAIRCIDERFSYIVSGLDIHPEQFENDNPVAAKLRNTTMRIPLFSSNQYDFIAQWLR